MRENRNLQWHRAVSLRQRGSYCRRRERFIGWYLFITDEVDRLRLCRAFIVMHWRSRTERRSRLRKLNANLIFVIVKTTSWTTA